MKTDLRITNMDDTKSPMKSNKKDFTSVVKKFSQNTSIHGIRYLGEKNLFIFRRLTWLLLFCASATLLVYQITDRIIHYYSWPVTVNVKVNYNTSVQFPAVTICNQNAFKATLAAERNWYRLLEYIYTNNSGFDLTYLDQHNYSSIKLDQLLLETAHKREDFVIQCTWKGKPCDWKNFTKTITDHGVCYTFSTNQNDAYISSPGLENGLKLTLNVEQYEYMPGPHDAAGIKMLVHTPGEFPLVHALGQAIPTGNHIYAGIKLNMINNRPYPYGNCGIKKLDYVDVYSSEACRLDCQTRVAEEKCNCRNPYMLSKRGSPSVCTLKQYIGCLRDVKVNVDRWRCSCPVPCSFQIYESEVSYAGTSHYSIDKLLENENITQLKQSLLNAKEISARMDRTKFGSTVELAQLLNLEYSNLHTLGLNSLEESVKRLQMLVRKEYEVIFGTYKFKERLYRFQIYNVVKNFIRGRNAMNERTFHIIALAYAEFGLAIKNKIKHMMNQAETETKLFYYMSAMEMIENRRQLVNMCLKNYSDLYTAYKEGTRIFDYQFENIPRTHNNASVPINLIKLATDHDSYSRKFGPRLGERLNETIWRLNTLEQLVYDEYHHGNTTVEEIENAVDEYYRTMRNYLYAKSVFDEYIVEWPVGILENRLEKFNLLWNSINSNYEDIFQNLVSTIKGIQNATFTLSYIKSTVIQILNNYLFLGNISKLSTAEIISSKNVQQKILELQNFFDQVRSREHRLLDTLTRINEDSIDFWTIVVQDNDSVDYYHFVNRTKLTRNLSEILNETKREFIENRKLLQFSKIIQNMDNLFFATFEKVTEDLSAFKDSIRIDNDFLRQNLLKLDIFYRQMSYEQIDQQEAYDFFALICDIGGSMGLFIGASVLSLFEIFDLVMSQSLMRIRRKLLLEVKDKNSYK
ncbi:hypothetical protein KUTeg_024197 [Tegillarca granosa]|uniref:Uncharacterized protein n=1 Tax=Tegillarca granosa TaxID=220873 RepID=A0ABQ9DWM9_TEGGR|nr:hypothetical protein KUTeg_024197 [Tegillarca granosa]